MKFLWLVAWRNLWRHRRRSLITATAMAVGVALCMATIAIDDGMFLQMFDVMVEQELGHVQVHHPDYPKKKLVFDSVHDVSSALPALDAVPGTVGAAPRLDGYALVGGETKSAGALLLGVDPVRERRVSKLAERVREGRFLSDEPAGEIVLGYGLAEDIEAEVGDTVVAVTQAADGSMGNELYTVVGIFKTGNSALDRAGSLLHIADVQALMVLDDQAHSITLLTTGAEEVDAYAKRVADTLHVPLGHVELPPGQDAPDGALEVLTWHEASPQAAQILAMRSVATFMVLGIVFVVAAFGVVNTMMMSVFERTRELGVLRALGIRPGRLVALIVLESFFLAGLAAVIGLVMGGLLDWYLVVHGLDFSSSAPEGFSFEGVMIDPVMRGYVAPEGILLTVAAVFVVSVLASLWPAWRAAWLQPVEAIRTE